MKRKTVYCKDDLRKALKIKSVEITTPVSDLVNEAVCASRLEGAEDLEAFKEGDPEPLIVLNHSSRSL